MGWTALAPRSLFASAPAKQARDTGSAAQFLPLFPLNLVAFPDELVLLHIFEPRYKQLIGESAERGISFGIVTIVAGGASSIGTEMQLERVLRVDDSGAMDIAVRGVRAFQLHSFRRVVEGKLYSGGLVSFRKNDPAFVTEIQSAVVQQYNRSRDRSGSRQQIAAPYPQNLSFVIGHDTGLSQAQELQLLTMAAEHDRQAYLLAHLRQSR
jgi:Lon protease-like protein